MARSQQNTTATVGGTLPTIGMTLWQLNNHESWEAEMEADAEEQGRMARILSRWVWTCRWLQVSHDTSVQDELESVPGAGQLWPRHPGPAPAAARDQAEEGYTHR